LYQAIEPYHFRVVRGALLLRVCEARTKLRQRSPVIVVMQIQFRWLEMAVQLSDQSLAYGN